MAYKILHIPSATCVYECVGGNIKHGNIPLLTFEVTNPEYKKYYIPVLCKTKTEAEQILSVLINAIITKRELYQRKPELYSCCLNKIFYEIVKE